MKVTDRSLYTHKMFIAVVGRKIVAHDYDFEKVYPQTQKYGEDPVFDKVPDAEILIYGSV